MVHFPAIRLGLLAIAVLAGCVACSTSDPGASAGDTVSTRAALPSTRLATVASHIPPTSSGAHRDANDFCALASKIGLASIAVTGDGKHTNATTLLRGIDALDAVAPAQIKSDFHTFDKLEHTILEPSGSAPPDPGADVATAMAHVSQYLSHTCQLG